MSGGSYKPQPKPSKQARPDGFEPVRAPPPPPRQCEHPANRCLNILDGQRMMWCDDCGAYAWFQGSEIRGSWTLPTRELLAIKARIDDKIFTSMELEAKRSLESGPPPRVFCKDCRFHLPTPGVFTPPASCTATTKIDPVRGEVADYVDCRKRNEGLDCALFEAWKPPREGPRAPWWKRWWREFVELIDSMAEKPRRLKR